MTRIQAFSAVLRRAIGASGRAFGLGLRAIGRVMSRVLGRWQWTPAPWMAWAGVRAARAGRYVAARPAVAAVGFVGLLAFAGLVHWYVNRPKPHYVACTVEAPALTEYEKGIATIH